MCAYVHTHNPLPVHPTVQYAPPGVLPLLYSPFSSTLQAPARFEDAAQMVEWLILIESRLQPEKIVVGDFSQLRSLLRLVQVIMRLLSSLCEDVVMIAVAVGLYCHTLLVLLSSSSPSPYLPLSSLISFFLPPPSLLSPSFLTHPFTFPPSLLLSLQPFRLLRGR